MLTEAVAEYPAVAGRPIEKQKPSQEILVGVEARINVGDDITPVFGETIAPGGLSGVIRRLGYKYPEHHAARWMIVLLGDRVDVWESRARRNPIRTLAVLAAAAMLLRPRSRRR